MVYALRDEVQELKQVSVRNVFFKKWWLTEDGCVVQVFSLNVLNKEITQCLSLVYN